MLSSATERKSDSCPSMLLAGSAPQLHFSAFGRQFEGEFHDRIFHWNAEHELLRPAPGPNPTVFRAEKDPPRPRSIGRVESAVPQRPRTDEVHHLGIVP